jgi:nitrite reductase/ring-hydroxylating ferredoxin subunit
VNGLNAMLPHSSLGALYSATQPLGIGVEPLKVVVGRVEEFASGDRRIVTVGGRAIGVFRVDDRFFAVRNRCPHQGGPLAAGRVFHRIVSDAPGQVCLGTSVLVSCPWHGWQWDMQTGEAYVSDDPRVRTYEVSVQTGEQLAGEPLAAETFAVTVEDDYVVLDA